MANNRKPPKLDSDEDKFKGSHPELQVKLHSPNALKASNQKGPRPKTYEEEREEMLNSHKNYLDAAESSWISRPEVVPAIRISKRQET